MKTIIISLDFDSFEYQAVLIRELALFLDNETCSKGLNCSFTGDFIDGSVNISLSKISGEYFTFDFFVDVVSLVKDIFEKKNIFLKVKSVSSF